MLHRASLALQAGCHKSSTLALPVRRLWPSMWTTSCWAPWCRRRRRLPVPLRRCPAGLRRRPPAPAAAGSARCFPLSWALAPYGPAKDASATDLHGKSDQAIRCGSSLQSVNHDMAVQCPSESGVRVYMLICIYGQRKLCTMVAAQ